MTVIANTTIIPIASESAAKLAGVSVLVDVTASRSFHVGNTVDRDETSLNCVQIASMAKRNGSMKCGMQ